MKHHHTQIYTEPC